MNKGVVVEVSNDIATIMSEDGRFLRVNAFKGLYQGMEMAYNDLDIVRNKNVNKKDKTSFVFKFSQLVAAVVLGVALLSGSYVYYDYNFAIYASVTLDVNPSMQLDIGKNSQIVDVEELNLDAEKLLEGLDLNGQSVVQAISKVENRLKEKGYFNSEKENFMLLGYMNINGKLDMKALKNKVENSAIKEANAANILLQVKSVNVNPALVKLADGKVSAGKQTYVNQLKQQGIIDKNTNVVTAKIPALFESQNMALNIDTSVAGAVAPSIGEASVVVTITETRIETPTPSEQQCEVKEVVKVEKSLGVSTTTIGPDSDSSEKNNSTVTITIIPNDKITPTPITPVETGIVEKIDKTIDILNSKTKQSVTVPVPIVPAPAVPVTVVPVSVVPVGSAHTPTTTISPILTDRNTLTPTPKPTVILIITPIPVR